jgi:thiamine pyrophosphokinase
MRVVIVANGVMREPEEEFARWVIAVDGDLDDDCVIVGVNGGTKHLLICGYTPQHVIGDMDSIVPGALVDLKSQGVVLHQHPAEKDETDLELALLWAAEHYPETEIIILGAMGGRPDQALANLLLLALPELVGRNVVLVDGSWQVCVIHGGETHHFRGSAGDTLSLIPLGGKAEGVATSGLKYPLTHETLHFGQARGVSNEFTKHETSVYVGSGMVWGFHRRKNDK